MVLWANQTSRTRLDINCCIYLFGSAILLVLTRIHKTNLDLLHCIVPVTHQICTHWQNPSTDWVSCSQNETRYESASMTLKKKLCVTHLYSKFHPVLIHLLRGTIWHIDSFLKIGSCFSKKQLVIALENNMAFTKSEISPVIFVSK